MNNRKEQIKKFVLNVLKYVFNALITAVLISILMGCDEDRRCKTWTCESWDSSGNREYIQVASPNQQLYEYCKCIEKFDRIWID